MGAMVKPRGEPWRAFQAGDAPFGVISRRATKVDPLVGPSERLTALLIVEGPLTFRRIVEAHEVRGWPTEPLHPLITAMLRNRVITENRDIEYALIEED